MTADLKGKFEELARRFEAKGYFVRRHAYFSTVGIMVWMQPRDTGAGINVMDAGVMLYAGKTGLEARVTQHGGPHWLKAVSTFDELEAIGESVLTSKRGTSPGDGWTAAY